jgi:hypothetical protein
MKVHMLASHRHVRLLCAATLIACSADSGGNAVAPRFDVFQASPDESGPSVTGHINITQQPSGELRTFSFTARVMPDGSVQGQYVNHNRQGDAVNHGEIDCLQLIGTNGAVLSGPIRKHTDPAFEGGRTIFRVEDNGEGADDPPDRVSLLSIFQPGPAPDCITRAPLNTSPIEGGNIQVRP